MSTLREIDLRRQQRKVKTAIPMAKLMYIPKSGDGYSKSSFEPVFTKDLREIAEDESYLFR